MSAVGPEFFNFIKKLEENGDKIPINNDQESPTDFVFNNSRCHVCNGYYGASFDEPVCVICHTFLFPDVPSYVPTSYIYTDKTDDGDSGNDEPSDLNFSSDRKLNRAYAMLTRWLENSLDNEISPDDNASKASGSNSSASIGHGIGSGLGRGIGVGLGIGRGIGLGGGIGGGLGRGIGASLGRGLVTTIGDRGPSNREGFLDDGEPLFRVPKPAIPFLPSLARRLLELSTPRPPDDIPIGLVEQLPSEVLLTIFSYLDDMTLCACSFVCVRWRRLVRAHVPGDRWAAFVAKRWPLYTPFLGDIDWHATYQTLVDSCFCRTCIAQMCVQKPLNIEENRWRANKLTAELKMMRNDPPEGIGATPLDAGSCHWQASVTGPVGSPYEGGIFYLYVQVPFAYPMKPPIVRFLTRILHPNVSRHGDVGIDSVHHNWTLALTISKVLISIQSLLTDPYTAVCMEPEVGEMYMTDRPRFDALARQWTWKYAMVDALQHPQSNYD